MSTYKTIGDTIKDIEYWLRLATFMHQPLKLALLNVLHNTSSNPFYVGLPSDPSDLYQNLSTRHYATIQRLVAKKVLQQNHVELLFPTNKTSTDSQEFDITLIVVLIRNCTTLPAPLKGWNDKKPPDSDTGVAADVVRGREWRNYVHHTEPSDVYEVVFNMKWDEGVGIVKRLGLTYDTSRLKVISLDPKHDAVLSSLLTFMNQLKNKQDAKFKIVMQQTNDLETNNKTLFDRVDTIAKEMASLNNPGAINDKIDEKDTCCYEVARFISSHHDNEILSQHLLNKNVEKNNFLENVAQENITISDIIDKMSWKALKSSLEMLERGDVVAELQEKTMLTKGIRNASIKLRQQYIKELIDCLVEQPLSSSSDQCSFCIPRKDVYIDLAVLQASFIDKEVNNSDRDALLKLNYLNRTSLSIDDLFQANDQLVFVRGVAGIGKSTLLTMYTLKWAKGELAVDGNRDVPPIEFIFTVTCRELNMYTNSSSEPLSLDLLFKDKYPEVFESITLEDLQSVSSQVLIIIDGLDELQDIYLMDGEEEKSPCVRNLKMVLDMVEIKGGFLKNHKTIACGRPKSCEFIKSRFIQKYLIKTVEVCGFSEQNVLRYIDNFFSEEKDGTKAENVKQQVTKSSNLKVMSTVPVFLWVICNVYGEDLISSPISTNTELYLYACLVFLRNHLHGLSHTADTNRKYRHLVAIVQDGELLSSLFALMILSVRTYMNNQILFTDKDIKGVHCPLHLEQTGFIVKFSRGNLQKPVYQFRHLVLQEFLCGLYLCITKFITPFRSNKELTSCIPTIVGIQRMCKEQSNELFLELFSNLTAIHNKASNLVSKSLSSIRNLTFKRYIKKHLLKPPKSMVRDKALLIDGSKSDCIQFMATYFEGLPTIDFHPLKTCDIINLYSSTDLRNALHLVNTLETRITTLSLRTKTFSQDCVDLVKRCVNRSELQAEIIIANTFYNGLTAIYCTENHLYLYLSRNPENGKFYLPDEIKELSSRISIHLPAFENYFTDLVELVDFVRSVRDFVVRRNGRHLHINDGPYGSMVDTRIDIARELDVRTEESHCVTIRDCGEFESPLAMHWTELLVVVTQSYYLKGASNKELIRFLPRSNSLSRVRK